MATPRIPAVVRAEVAGLPLPVRAALACAFVFGVPGALCGLVLGLAAYPPTAWFAVLEVGVPAALGGSIVGFLGAGIPWILRGGGAVRR